jgi:hypothetical protein
VSELHRIHIHAKCVNWSAGISYPHYRACSLIGSFLLGFTSCHGRETESDRNTIFRCSFICYFFWGFILWLQGTCFYVWLWYKRERAPKHPAIWLILGGYAPSYKSDSLVFRYFFIYLNILAREYSVCVFKGNKPCKIL